MKTLFTRSSECLPAGHPRCLLTALSETLFDLESRISLAFQGQHPQPPHQDSKPTGRVGVGTVEGLGAGSEGAAG